jgi:NAD(P)-dependent dehydrogenase (short-subunit alcohol dehydrogenase family)
MKSGRRTHDPAGANDEASGNRDRSSSGIGRATALALAHAGYDVGITFEERARDVVKTIESFGVCAAIARQDLTKPAEAPQALESLIRQLGRLDAFVNNVGINHCGAFLELPLEEWYEILTVNLTGACVARRPPGTWSRAEPPAGL